MYIDVALRPSLAPQLNILVNDIPIVQVACVLCRASASIDWSLSHLGTTTLPIEVLVLIKLIVGKRLPTVKFLLPFLNISLLVLNRFN